MITVTQLLTSLTIDEAKTSIYEVCDVLGVPTTGWRAGAVVRLVVTLVAICLVACSKIYVSIGRGGFRSTAVGSWLTLYAYDVAGIDRRAAVFAPGEITLTNVGGGVYNPAAYDTVFQNSTTGKTYWNTEAYSLGSGTVLVPTVATVPIAAIEAGSASTSGPATIDTIVTTMPSVTCSNAKSVVGIDEETDAELSPRVDESLDAISPNGPAGAYLAIAKTATRVADGSLVGVTRARVNENSPTSEVVVTLATATGAIAGTAGDPATALGACNLAIQTNVVPLGVVSVTVQSATSVAVPVTYSAWYYTSSGLASSEVQKLIEDALVAWFPKRPIAGDVIPPAMTGYVYQNMVEAVIKSAHADIFKVVCTQPSADLALAETEVPVLGTIAPTLIQPVAP